jgi:hypothetical protein
VEGISNRCGVDFLPKWKDLFTSQASQNAVEADPVFSSINQVLLLPQDSMQS